MTTEVALSKALARSERSIRRVLEHVGGAERWYLDRPGLGFPREDVLDDVFERLSVVRTHSRAALSALAGDDRVVEARLELWSARKLMRRMLWHERDHTAHAIAFRQRLMQQGGVSGRSSE